MNKVGLIVFIVFIFQSCTIIGLKDGYNKLSDNNKNRVITYKDSISLGDGFIQVVNHYQLHEILKKDNNEYQIVYDFIPHCSTKSCISTVAFLEICKSYSITPVVVSRYLDNSLFNLGFSEIKLYGIDNKFYGTSYVLKYISRFYDNLTNGISDGDYGSNMLLFREGDFLRCIDISEYKKELSPDNINSKRVTPYTKKDNPFWN